jgi:hypothetical protein
MSFPQKVKSTLWAIVDAMACNKAQFVRNPGKDFTRGRKLGFIQLIHFFLCMESGCISHELLKYFYFLPDEVTTASAFIQQRAKLLPETFRHILRQFNLRFPAKGLMGQYSLIAADGCEFNIARNPRDPSTFHPASGRSKKGFRSLHTISLYDLFSKRYLDVVVQPGRLKNEFAALCQLIDRFPYGGFPLFVADRGFASYNVFAHAIEKGYFFAIRAKDINIKRLLAADSLSDRVDRWADVILTRSNAKRKRLHPELGPLYRCICKAVPFDFITDSRSEYHIRLRIVRFQIAEGVYENIITNLPSDEFSPEQIKHIYHLRWGQETSFRDLKHTMGTANFHSKAPQYIEYEILCRMTLYNFCTIITMEVPMEKKTEKWEYQVNLSMAIKICFAFLSDHMGPGNVNGLISRYILPIRPDRTYARQVRFQAPASFAYRFV